jgi:hypothetical protein
MTQVAELTRLISALQAAQAMAFGNDRVAIAATLRELDDAWTTCPPDSLDAFDRANIQLARSTLLQLLDRDGSEAVAQALPLARQLGPGE